MEAPKKIYLQVCGDCKNNDCKNCKFEDLEVNVTWCRDKIFDKDIEYTRTDAFIEKAVNYLNSKLYDWVQVEHFGTATYPETILKQDFIEDFKLNFLDTLEVKEVDEVVENFAKSKRKELEKMIPGFVDDRNFTDIVLNFYERGIRDGVQMMLERMTDIIVAKNATHVSAQMSEASASGKLNDTFDEKNKEDWR